MDEEDIILPPEAHVGVDPYCVLCRTTLKGEFFHALVGDILFNDWQTDVICCENSDSTLVCQR